MVHRYGDRNHRIHQTLPDRLALQMKYADNTAQMYFIATRLYRQSNAQQIYFQLIAQFRKFNRDKLSQIRNQLLSPQRPIESFKRAILQYSSDWIVLVASLAKLAAKYESTCMVALGFGNTDLHIKSGLLWKVNPIEQSTTCTTSTNRSGKLLNTKQFEKLFIECKSRFCSQTQCRGSTRKPNFIMGLITLSSTSCPTESHLLSFVYDIVQNTIEIFDPNGGLKFLSSAFANENSDQYNAFLRKYYEFSDFENTIQRFFKSRLGISSVELPNNWCPVGIQYIQESTDKHKIKSTTERMEDFAGYCSTYSLWWLESRLKYPGIPRAELINLLKQQFTKNNINLTKWIMEYSQQLASCSLDLMTVALRLTGRPVDVCNEMINQYAIAKTQCIRLQNLVYHQARGKRNVNEQNAKPIASNVCRRSSSVTNPIIALVQFKIHQAVALYTKNRLILA